MKTPPLLSLTLSALLLSAISSMAAESRTALKGIPATEPEDRICFAMYTTQSGILKMNVQFYPLKDQESRQVFLEIERQGKWEKVGEAQIQEDGYGYDDGLKIWLAQFEIKNWDMTATYRYRVSALDGAATYEGVIRKDPVDKEEIVVAAFTGNTNKDKRLKPDIVANVKAQDPDLLFFSGDQVYIHTAHLPDWLRFGRQFGELIKDRPTICLPDDHDVGNGNLWGDSGRVWNSPDDFRFQGFKNPEFVRRVEQVQTGHLPSPYDPTPIERDIGVYYTSLKIGKVDFAIIEDRKFKSSPEVLEKHLAKQGIQHTWRNNSLKEYSGTPDQVDVPGARLLGQRQLEFLNDWATCWENIHMKAVLSQTLFAKAHTADQYDLDANGWPQTPRNKAVKTIRKAFALHINGDQHLATISQYGTDQWRDSGFSFCVPSIANHYPRSWNPKTRDGEAIKTDLPNTGDYYDTFGNRLSMYAYVNPDKKRANKWAGEWGAKAEGYGLIRFNTKTRKITMECWPRGVDAINQPEQYRGWPVTIDQFDNYGREATGWLPTVTLSGAENAVFQIIDESTGEVVYTVRSKGKQFSPKVFSDGPFTLRATRDSFDDAQVFKNVVPSTTADSKQLKVNMTGSSKN